MSSLNHQQQERYKLGHEVNLSKEENPDFAYQDNAFHNQDEIGSKSIEEIKVEDEQKQTKKKQKKDKVTKSINSKLNEIEDSYPDKGDDPNKNNQEIENVKQKVAMESTIKDDVNPDKKKKQKEQHIEVN